MTKRPSILIAAFALLAGLAFTTPSQAGVQFQITSDSLTQSTTVTPSTDGTFTGYAVNPANLPAMYQPQDPTTPFVKIGHYNATASAPITVTGDLVYMLGVTVGSQTGTLTIDVNFNGTMKPNSTIPGVASAMIAGSTGIGGQFKLESVGISVRPDNGGNNILLGLSVPEPASMSLLGIGVAGLLSFRRIFKRKVSV